MRRWIVLALAVGLLLMPLALAETPTPDNETFLRVKTAVARIGEGRFEEAAKQLGKNWSASSLKGQIEEQCGRILTIAPQTDVAAAWQEKGAWRIAVPIEMPADGKVLTLVFTMKDGGCAEMTCITWREAEAAFKGAGNVVWNTAYNPGYIVVVD